MDGNAPDFYVIFHKILLTVEWKHSELLLLLIEAKNHIIEKDSTTLSMKIRGATPGSSDIIEHVFVCVFVLREVSGWSLVPTQGCGPHICRVGCWELRAREDTRLNPRRK